MKPEELLAAIKDADGLVIRSATKVTAELITAAPRLKVVGRAGTGLDNVDIPAASKRGIVVMNTPGGNTITTAEHAVSLMVAMARNIPQAAHSMREGRWEKKKFQGTEIFNKTLGIIGMGRIGTDGGGAGPGPQDAGYVLRSFHHQGNGRQDRGGTGLPGRTAWPVPTSSPSTPRRPRTRPSS